MYQHHEAHQAVRTVTESNHQGYPMVSGPGPASRRDEPAIRLSILATSGGVEFVRDDPVGGVKPCENRVILAGST